MPIYLIAGGLISRARGSSKKVPTLTRVPCPHMHTCTTAMLLTLSTHAPTTPRTGSCTCMHGRASLRVASVRYNVGIAWTAREYCLLCVQTRSVIKLTHTRPLPTHAHLRTPAPAMLAPCTLVAREWPCIACLCGPGANADVYGPVRGSACSDGPGCAHAACTQH